MKITQVTKRPATLIQDLTEIWESSVRATHFFLDETAIQNFKTTLPEIIKNVPTLVIALDTTDKPLAFMGLTGKEIDMLFVSDDQRGQGIGKALLLFAFENYQADQLTVNEQNPQAVGFYQHMGFETYRRTDKDGMGNPYPILYMQKKA